MSTGLEQKKKLIKFVESVAPFLSMIEKKAAAEEQEQQKIDEIVPRVVESLIKTNKITEEYRKQASEVLKDHYKTLEVLQNTAEWKDDEVKPVGEAVPGLSKVAAARNGAGVYVGSPDNSERESDRVFCRMMGVSVD